jgi:hypothetical protein
METNTVSNDATLRPTSPVSVPRPALVLNCLGQVRPVVTRRVHRGAPIRPETVVKTHKLAAAAFPATERP